MGLKINLFHFMSIGKSNEEIKEEFVLGNEEFSGINVMKWRNMKKKCGSPGYSEICYCATSGRQEYLLRSLLSKIAKYCLPTAVGLLRVVPQL